MVTLNFLISGASKGESLRNVQNFSHHKPAELENRSSGHSITLFDVVSFFFWDAAMETCWGDA